MSVNSLIIGEYFRKILKKFVNKGNNKCIMIILSSPDFSVSAQEAKWKGFVIIEKKQSSKQVEIFVVSESEWRQHSNLRCQ